MKALRSLITITLLSVMSLTKPVYAQDKLVFASDDWCPYVCNNTKDKPGFIVELVRQAFAMHGIEVEYKSMPFHKAIAAASKGEIDGVLAIARRGNKLMYPIQPQMYSQRKAYIRASDYWHYDTPNALEGRKLCIVLDYSMDSNTRRYFTRSYSTNPMGFIVEEGDDANITCMQKVARGEADVYIADENIVSAYLDDITEGEPLKAVDVLGERPSPLFVAFSPKLQGASTYVEKMVSAIESVRAVGDSKDLAVKYELCQSADRCEGY